MPVSEWDVTWPRFGPAKRRQAADGGAESVALRRFHFVVEGELLLLNVRAFKIFVTGFH